MQFFKVEKGVVVQKQPNAEDGFIEGPDDVVCGYIYKSGKFSAPVASWPDWPALIADRRYIAETSGTTIEGMGIDTGRDSQGLITGAAVQAIIDPNYSLRWKTSAGFIELSGSQILGVASAVRAHVQRCFNRESELLEAVAVGTISQTIINEGWPQ
ncbi:DUF4376 domain-containing protein [Pseudomonas syringae]|uniref:DUF4376 domain-containing protein n=1 Tax=Pseudomonas syringae TaxID=317 RepID=UPI00067D9684|nr:DUF4376 domain-containing protein [Pseudomonas syringae]